MREPTLARTHARRTIHRPCDIGNHQWRSEHPSGLIPSACPVPMSNQIKHFRLCDLVLASNIPIPELPAAPDRSYDLRFTIDSSLGVAPATIEWFHTWHLPNGQLWVEFGRFGADHVLRYPAIGDFLVSTARDEIRCCPHPDVPLNTIRHVLLAQVLPLFLSGKKLPVLHASAIAVPIGAVAFAGASGRGKSTLVSTFAVDGFEIITDDFLLLRKQGDHLVAVPSYPGLRLWPDTVTTLLGTRLSLPAAAHITTKKELFGPEHLRYSSDRVRLSAIYFLESAGEGVQIYPLRGPEAFVELVQSSFLLDPSDREALEQQFRELTGLAKLPLFFRLRYPHSYSALPEVKSAILKHFAREE